MNGPFTHSSIPTVETHIGKRGTVKDGARGDKRKQPKKKIVLTMIREM